MGQLQVTTPDHRFHGDTISSLVVVGNQATWSGSGRWDGAAGYSFTAVAVDAGKRGKRSADTFSITIRDAGGAVVWAATETLEGGNITIH
jgi:hypothetical protein